MRPHQKLIHQNQRPLAALLDFSAQRCAFGRRLAAGINVAVTNFPTAELLDWVRKGGRLLLLMQPATLPLLEAGPAVYSLHNPLLSMV